MKFCDSIGAYDSTYVARSEDLCGTSNCVFSDWSLRTYFSIDAEGNPKARFEVRNEPFGKNVLFVTNSYKELQQWFADHSKEIQKQIDSKKEEWINSYNQEGK